MTVVAVVLFLIMAAKIGSLVFDGKVEKLRPAASELTKACEDYVMSPSDRELTMKFAKIMKEFADLSYVLFVDRYGKIHSRGKGVAIESAERRLAELDPAKKDVNLIELRGEKYVDIGGVTSTLPRLPVHLGFGKSLTDAETRGVLWNRGAIALLVLAGGLVGGFLFSVWVTRPLMTLSTRAERLSLGDMGVRLDLKPKGEIATVYGCLERLRESVLYALKRLDNEDQPIE